MRALPAAQSAPRGRASPANVMADRRRRSLPGFRPYGWQSPHRTGDHNYRCNKLVIRHHCARRHFRPTADGPPGCRDHGWADSPVMVDQRLVVVESGADASTQTTTLCVEPTQACGALRSPGPGIDQQLLQHRDRRHPPDVMSYIDADRARLPPPCIERGPAHRQAAPPAPGAAAPETLRHRAANAAIAMTTPRRHCLPFHWSATCKGMLMNQAV